MEGNIYTIYSLEPVEVEFGEKEEVWKFAKYMVEESRWGFEDWREI